MTGKMMVVVFCFLLVVPVVSAESFVIEVVDEEEMERRERIERMKRLLWNLFYFFLGFVLYGLLVEISKIKEGDER